MNSLERLKVYLAILIVTDLLFMGALFAGGYVHRRQLQTIGRDSAPSIIAAQHIKVAIADMDAEAANELLAKPGEGAEALKAYNASREEAAGALIAAAENITYGDAERAPIKQLQIGLGEFEIKIQRARDFHERNDPQAIAVYQAASQIVENKLLPAADALDRANFNVLEETFELGRNLVQGTQIGVAAASLILLAMLVYVQWDLTQRVRRMLNPALLAASIVALAAGWLVFSHLSTAAEDLRVAKQDAFTSMHALWQARALAYSANASESKFLLFKDGSSEQASFSAKSSRIWDGGERLGSNSKSYLGEELANITFPGEKEAVDETLKRWLAYLNTDARIRQLKSTGKLDEAIRLCLGRNQGESDWEFSRFDEALAKTIEVNQKAFDRSVASGFERLAGFSAIVAVTTAVIAGLCVVGLMARIREFL